MSNTEYCENCMEDIIYAPIESEKEITICPDGIEMDVPIRIYFCSEKCKEEFFNQPQIMDWEIIVGPEGEKYRIKAGDILIADTFGNDENAARIVKAVNNHDALLEALQEVTKYMTMDSKGAVEAFKKAVAAIHNAQK